MKHVVLVPADRIGVLTAEVREEIRSKLSVVVILIKNGAELDGEGLELQTAANIVKAIGRGFSPVRAFRLFSEDQMFEIIELGSMTEARADIVRSRVIGTKGRMRERIEEASGAVISVYGKTIAMIGTWEQIEIAKKAIEMLITGAMHSSVEKYLLRAQK